MPLEGADMLRIPQFLELAHSKQPLMPWVPEKFLLFTLVVLNHLVIALGVLPLLEGTGMNLVLEISVTTINKP